MIINSGFESGIANWNVFSGDATITTDAFEGNSAIAFSSPGSGVDQSFSVIAGETYSLSGYGKTSAAEWSGLGLAFYDNQWNELDRVSTQVDDSDWTEYTLDAIAPTGASIGLLWTWTGATSGTTAFDNLNVETDATPPPPSDNLLDNSSFESGLARWRELSGAEAISSTDTFDGNQSLELDTDGSGVTQFASITGGETYSLSAYGKKIGGGWTGFGADVYDVNWNRLSGVSTSVAAADWSLFELEIPTAANARRIVTWFSKAGTSGSALYDQTSLSLAEGAANQLPSITSNGGAAIATLNIAENTTSIANINATDPDGDTEGNGLTYSLQGPDISQISINPNTGQLSFDGAPDFENPADSDGDNQYQVDVVVTDSQGGQDTQALSINVTDEVETSPSIFALADSNTIFVNEAAGVATVTAVRTGGAQGRVTLEYTTNEISGADTATADSDYTTPTFDGRLNTGQIVFEDGEVQASFTIPITDDTSFEGNETFAVGLQNPSAGSLGAPRTTLVTIVDNDAAPTLSISQPSLNRSEADATVSITVQRSGDSSGSASVNFSTSNGTAIAGEDYTATSGTLTFAANQTTRTITVPILDDTDVEGSEAFTVNLSNASGATLGAQTSSTVTILDNDLQLGDLSRSTAVTGLTQPTTLDWTPNGDYMLVAEKAGRVRVIDSSGTLRSSPLIDISERVNGVRDRGLLGLAIHPNFPSTPYIYLLYTHDPAETIGRTGLGGPDGRGNRPSQLARVTVNPATMVADPNSLTILAGTNSTWENTSQPTGNSTGDVSILPSGIVNGTTITAPANQIDVGTQDNDPDRPGLQNQNIRDYLATDSESHTIGDLEFGTDGYLYLSNGDGTSYNFLDPRTVRVQDVQNLSGKVLRIDPITGEGISSNPFFNGDEDSNQSKVFYLGLRNPFSMAFDPVTDLPVIGDVGWNTFEEIHTGPAGSNFGWPYLEGSNRSGRYRNLSQAVAFYNNGNRNDPADEASVFPILARTHGAPDNANAILVGDFYNSNTLMFGDINGGTLYAATLNSSRQVTNVEVFDSNIPFVVDMKMGPDGNLYGVRLTTGDILRWDPAEPPSPPQPPQPNLTASFTSFADVSDLNLNGNAASTSNRLRLTPASSTQAGSAFLEQPMQFTSITDFSSQFQFEITGGQGTNGADGFSFVLQNSGSGSNALGAAGGALGYDGIGSSIAIEFDTYQNGSDIDANHISILSDGNIRPALNTITAPLDLNSGSTLTAWVDYDGSTNVLEVYLDDDTTRPTNPLLTYNVDLPSVLGAQAYIGFTAGTGGRFNNHDILNWSFSSSV